MKTHLQHFHSCLVLIAITFFVAPLKAQDQMTYSDLDNLVEQCFSQLSDEPHNMGLSLNMALSCGKLKDLSNTLKQMGPCIDECDGEFIPVKIPAFRTVTFNHEVQQTLSIDVDMFCRAYGNLIAMRSALDFEPNKQLPGYERSIKDADDSIAELTPIYESIATSCASLFFKRS